MASLAIDRSPSWLQFRVLGTGVHAVQIPDVIAQLELWLRHRSKSCFVAVTGMHGIVEARRDPNFRHVLNSADLVVPDGMPLVWTGRAKGYKLRRRVYGPDLMETFCKSTGARWRHFFYGGAPGIPDRLSEILHERYGIQIAGYYSPPFRALTPEEDEDVTRLIRRSEADVLWVGLSTPRQEHWMYEHRERIGVPVMLGVGAAYDFITGRVKQAPMWMQENGLEWLFRLIQEPRRLWRRYLIYGTDFVWNVSLELLGLKHFAE